MTERQRLTRANHIMNIEGPRTKALLALLLLLKYLLVSVKTNSVGILLGVTVETEQTAQTTFRLVEEQYSESKGCVFLCDEEREKRKSKNYLFDVFDLGTVSVPLSAL